MSIVFHGIYMLALAESDREKARFLAGKDKPGRGDMIDKPAVIVLH